MPLRKLITLLMVSAMCLSDVWAQLENGKVYHFVCKGNNRALSSADNLSIGDAMLNNTNPFQLWIAVEGKGVNAGQFALRNLGNGLYLNSSEKHLEPWGLIPTIALDTPSYHYCVEKEKSGSTTYYVTSKHLFTKEPSTRFSPTLLAPCCKTSMPLWQKTSWTRMKTC